MNNKISGAGVGDTFSFSSGETKIRQCIGDFPDDAARGSVRFREDK